MRWSVWRNGLLGKLKHFVLFRIDNPVVTTTFDPMPRRSKPVVLPESEVPDPFADASAPVAAADPTAPSVKDVRTPDTLAAFDGWLHTSEGSKCGDLDRFIDVLAKGNVIRSKLALHDRLRTAFHAGVARR
jgi:hypothetical protein